MNPFSLDTTSLAGAVEAKGFTLLEMLVVLMMTGLIAGMVLPRIQKIFSAYEISEQRKNLTIALHGLGYKAYVLGRDLQLDSNHLSSGQGDMSNLLSIPQGWNVKTSHPIIFSANGTCSGGQLDIVDPWSMVERFKLHPPVCRLDRLEAEE